MFKLYLERLKKYSGSEYVMSKKRIIATVIAVIIVLGGIVMSSISTVISSLFSEDGMSEIDPFTETVESEGDSSKRIVHLTLNGEIREGTGERLFGSSGYNHEAFLKQLDKVKKDSSIKGVLLTVNTPGGGTYPSDEIYKKIEEIKQKEKKVYVKIGYNHKVILKKIDKMKKDILILGVLLTINTPGGSTYPSDEIYKKIEEIKQKDKKVYVHMDAMAASGGYYISAPADKIY